MLCRIDLIEKMVDRKVMIYGWYLERINVLDKNLYYGNCVSCKINRIWYGNIKKELYFLR